MSLRLLISILCYLAGAALCLRSLFLFPRLGRERMGPPLGGKPLWTGWMPGAYTKKGREIRRTINLSLVVGWVFLLVGMLLGQRA